MKFQSHIVKTNPQNSQNSWNPIHTKLSSNHKTNPLKFLIFYNKYITLCIVFLFLNGSFELLCNIEYNFCYSKVVQRPPNHNLIQLIKSEKTQLCFSISPNCLSLTIQSWKQIARHACYIYSKPSLQLSLWIAQCSLCTWLSIQWNNNPWHSRHTCRASAWHICKQFKYKHKGSMFSYCAI